MAYQGKHRRRKPHEPRKHKPKPKRDKPLSQPRKVARCKAAEFRELKTSLNLPPDWDVLLVGDGSVQHHTGNCGWGVTLWDRATKTRKVFYGGGSAGDCHFAELVPYIYALLWYTRRHGGKLARPRQVHIVTDSKNTAAQGNHLAEFLASPLRLRSTRFLWVIIQQMANDGYTFDWHWRKRGELIANRRMNRLAQAARWVFSTHNQNANDEPNRGCA